MAKRELILGVKAALLEDARRGCLGARGTGAG
jgi:hypothetical protein